MQGSTAASDNACWNLLSCNTNNQFFSPFNEGARTMSETLKEFSYSCLSLACSPGSNCTEGGKQSPPRRPSNPKLASASHSGNQPASGTQSYRQLQNTVDVRQAKVGDQLCLKTTQAIKGLVGRTVVERALATLWVLYKVVQNTSKSNVNHAWHSILIDLNRGVVADLRSQQ